MKILIIISLFAVAVALEPSLSCTYISSNNVYTCQLYINNPNGFNNFTEIGGVHLEGFTNENVTNLQATNGYSSIVPSIICDSFPNLDQISLHYTSLTEIGDSAFSECKRVTQLDFYMNRITSISTNAFATLHDLEFLFLDNNFISKLPENVFSSQQNLILLDLSSNPFDEISGEVFGPLQNLRKLYLSNTNISTINNQLWLSQLDYLDVSNNTIEIIHDGAFQGLSKLRTLKMDRCRLRQVQSSYFDDLENMISLSLHFNEIEDLPEGAFVAMPNLYYIGLWGNRLKTVRRNSFGILTRVQTIDLDGNVVNALDRAIIDDAVNLNTLYFDGNLCASTFFGSFLTSRAQHLIALERCFRNMLYIVDAVTESGDEYSFFEAPQPGIVIRVNASNEVQIALSPFNATSTPIIEIMIGATNNTRSIIRLNQETNEVNASTPNIIIQDQWNDFKVTWENKFLFVFSGNNTYPFMGFTMQNFFPINFYGLRSVTTRATWIVRPLE